MIFTSDEKEFKILKEIVKEIDKKGGSVFYVGGFVRDLLLNKKSKDIDVEIHNISIIETKQILQKYGKVDVVGESFGVIKIFGLDIDFSFPRKELSTGDKHTDFDVIVDPFLSYRDSAKRRDLTMNSIMKNVLTGEYLDYFNGRADIEKKVVKYVDETTFIEDSLRPLRACQFASRLGFTIDDSVIELSKKMNYKTLSKERVEGELNKALLSDKPSIAFNYLYEMGILNQLFPEISKLKGSPQNLEFHPEGDVWNHTMLVIDEGAKVKHKSSNPLYFMYACLLHDIGKPSTTQINEQGKITSYSHEIVGAEMIPRILGKLTTEKNIKKYCSKLTQYHMKSHHLLEMSNYKIKKIMLDCNMYDLLLLNYCDVSGRFDTGYKKQRQLELNEKYRLIKKLSNGDFGKIEPYITGKYLISKGYTQGEQLGKDLKNYYLLQLQGKSKKELEVMIMNKIENNSKVDNIENFYKEYIQSDKRRTKNNPIIVKRFIKIINDSPIRVKFNSTSDKIPFIEFYTTVDNETKRLTIFPDCIIESDVRNRFPKIVCNNYSVVEENRFKILLKYVEKYKIPDSYKYLMYKSFYNLI